MTVRAVLSVVLMCACAPLAPRVPVALDARLEPSQGQLAVGKAFAAAHVGLTASRCATISAHFGAEARELEAWCAKLEGQTPLKFGLSASYALGEGLVGRLRVSTVGAPSAFQAKQPVWVSPTLEVIDDPFAWPSAKMALTRLTAHVRLFPDEEWLEGTATLTFALPAPRAVVPLRFAGRGVGGEGGLKVVQLSSRGVALPFTIDEDERLLVAEVPSGQPVDLRWAGEVRQRSGSWVTREGAVLRGEDGWLPTLGPFSPALTHFEVRVEAPPGYALFGQGDDLEGTALGTGGRLTAAEYTLYGGPGYVTRAAPVAGTLLLCAAGAASAAHLGPTFEQVARLLNGLRSFLGDYPAPRLRVVESGFPGGYGAISNITLGEGGFEHASDTFIAHEVAHGWFGGQVRCDGTGRVVESLAEYVSSLVVDEAQRAAQRAEWERRANGLTEASDFEVASARGLVAAARPGEYTVTYQKGPLLLARVEARHGRACLERALRALLEGGGARSGVCWGEVSTAIGRACGADAEALARALLTQKGHLPP